MEPWFVKSLLATVCIVPAFLAIPFFHRNVGVPPLIFMTWYFGGVALSIVLLRVFRGRTADLVPHSSVILAVLIGMTLARSPTVRFSRPYPWPPILACRR